MVSESPDVPWAKNYSDKVPEKIKLEPTEAGLFLFEFLKSKNILSGKILELGAGKGKDAYFLAKQHYEMHVVDKEDNVDSKLELHGIQTYSANAFEYWLFEDQFYEVIFDLNCYTREENKEKREFYRNELKRVSANQGYFMIGVKKDQKHLLHEISEIESFKLVAQKESNEKIYSIFLNSNLSSSISWINREGERKSAP